MKKTVLFFFIISLISCHPYKIDYEKFIINQVELKQNQSKDSLFLKVDYTIPPKSFGKKALLVCNSLVVDGNDTIKFHTRSSIGEKHMDCAMISYKHGVNKVFSDTMYSCHSFSDSAKVLVQFTQYKGKKEPTVLFEKLVS